MPAGESGSQQSRRRGDQQPLMMERLLHVGMTRSDDSTIVFCRSHLFPGERSDNMPHLTDENYLVSAIVRHHYLPLTVILVTCRE